MTAEHQTSDISNLYTATTDKCVAAVTVRPEKQKLRSSTDFTTLRDRLLSKHGRGAARMGNSNWVVALLQISVGVGRGGFLQESGSSGVDAPG